MGCLAVITTEATTLGSDVRTVRKLTGETLGVQSLGRYRHCNRRKEGGGNPTKHTGASPVMGGGKPTEHTGASPMMPVNRKT